MINRVRLLSFVYLCYFPFRKVRHSEVYIYWTWKILRSVLFCGKISEVYIDFNEIVNSNTPRATVRSRRRFVRNTERDTVLTSYSEDRSLSTLRLSRGTFIYVLSFIRNRTQQNFIAEEPTSADMRSVIISKVEKIKYTQGMIHFLKVAI